MGGTTQGTWRAPPRLLSAQGLGREERKQLRYKLILAEPLMETLTEPTDKLQQRF